MHWCFVCVRVLSSLKLELETVVTYKHREERPAEAWLGFCVYLSVVQLSLCLSSFLLQCKFDVSTSAFPISFLKFNLIAIWKPDLIMSAYIKIYFLMIEQ